MSALIRRVGHVLLSVMFIKGGSDAFRQPGGRVDAVARAGLPQPEFAVRANGGAMALAGAMLALDVAPRLAATILTACIVPTTVVGHAFWRAEGATRQSQEIQFAKNLGLLGGLLLVLAEPKA